MILPMVEEAAHSDLEQLAYLRGREDEPGMQCDMQWDRTTLPEALRRCVSKWGTGTACLCRGADHGKCIRPGGVAGLPADCVL